MMDRRLTLAKQILQELEKHCYQAYLVGGYVRDKLLGRSIKDIDIATSARPETVMALFERAEPTGLQHGTVTVIREGVPFEVTTFRIEGSYEQFRRPSGVQFVDDLIADLSRRDFTINAMALDGDDHLIDPFGGAADLNRAILRCVGDAQLRFGEDALRMLRCVRFAAEYRLDIHPDTWRALLDHAPLLRHIAMERIRVELERIVEGSHPERGLRLLADSGLYLHFKTDIGLDMTSEWLYDANLSLAAYEEASIRWALLFVLLESSPENTELVLRNLTFSQSKAREIIALVSFYNWLSDTVKLHNETIELSECFKLGAVRYGRPITALWLRLAQMSTAAIAPFFSLPQALESFIRNGQAWLDEMPAATLQELQISGRDLLANGFRPGPEIGRTLEVLLQEAALCRITNTKDDLLARAIQLQQGEREQR